MLLLHGKPCPCSGKLISNFLGGIVLDPTKFVDDKWVVVMNVWLEMFYQMIKGNV